MAEPRKANDSAMSISIAQQERAAAPRQNYTVDKINTEINAYFNEAFPGGYSVSYERLLDEYDSYYDGIREDIDTVIEDYSSEHGLNLTRSQVVEIRRNWIKNLARERFNRMTK
jgi:hypothetical protein